MAIDNTPGIRHNVADDRELVPAIWPFKVEWMEFVGPDGLAEWEDSLRTKVGLPVDALLPSRPGCATISGSGDGWDDSDYWGRGC